ncbi:MAG: MFS transporter [Candidatus Thorarchaeota archaeon]
MAVASCTKQGCGGKLETSHESTGTGEISSSSKILGLSILSSLVRLSNAFNQVALPLFAIYLAHDDGAFYGLLVACAGYVQSGVLFPAGWISDSRGRGITILIGGVFSGICLLLLPFAQSTLAVLILYSLSGVGTGFNVTSLKSLIADHTEKGEERTKSYGYTMAFATVAAIAGSFLGGFILDPVALPGISEELVRFAIVFVIMGSLRIVAGFTGFVMDSWLNHSRIRPDNELAIIVDPEPEKDTKNDMITAGLFGVSRLIMGFTSGMVIPYLITWIYVAFVVDPVILGSIPAVSNITLASGALVVGLSSERIGKIKIISILYLLASLLTFGLVSTPIFLIMAVFYVARNAVANMAQPAVDSLFMGEVSRARRGRSFAVIRVMWTFPRQTGTLITSYLLSIGFLGGIAQFGRIVFPIAMLFYPISVIPMYLAVRRNERLAALSLQTLPKAENSGL